MANTFSMIGSDTITINGRNLSDFANGEICKITFSTELATVKTGKTGNSIISQNASGFQGTMELKVLRGAADDKFMNSILESYRGNPTGFTLMSGQAAKQIGDGRGNLTADTVVLSGGVPSKQVEFVANVEGDTEQAIAMYTIQWAYCDRSIA